ncbi:protein sidekick-2-like, partial [Actinia tenebrosa]|uniref:Protein sidekick-2-like n=1 Tax=Actinia tenebrosa TaxID=6105 RepID=A0A6P8HSK3_ACTTE
MRFGFYDLVIGITDKKCSNAPGDLYEALPGNQVFTGSNEFQPDDIEVLIVGDSLCDPPCLKGERCDEVLNKCVCDLGRRDYKLCLERRDLQDKRDKFCRVLKKSEYYARYDLKENISVGKRWRCYGKYALTDDRLRYNTTKLSMDYETRHDELMAIEAEFPKLIYDRIVEYLSIIYWPLDHPNDLKDLNNDQWSSNVYNGQPVRGVIDGALLLNGTGDAIKFPLSSTINDSCFFHPRGECPNGLAISLWIKYYFSPRNGGNQVFFSTSVDGQDRGFVIYQINSSFPHVAVSVIHSKNRCTKVVEVARGIWTHLAVVYHNRNNVDIPEVYINSTKNATVIWKGCEKQSYKSVSNDYFTIGQSDVGAPYASIDDIVIVLNAETYLNSLSNVYNYYKGGENLHLNASFVLTSESWNDNLLNRESDIYRRITTSLLKNISDANIKRTAKSQEIRFWKKEGESIVGFTGCNILIGFHGQGYSQMDDVVSYLEQATDIISDLNSSSNEVYLKGPQPVEVSIYGNSMKINIQWNPGDKNLTHGILQKYVLFYVNGEDPSDQGHVDVVQDELGDSTNYNMTVTKYFSRYVVSVRVDTLEGEGKVSKGVNITTGILAPLGTPQTVHSWNLSSVSIAVSWTDINKTYLRGPIAGYSIRINLADSSERAWESSKFQSILRNKSVIFEGLYKYTKYNVHVAGVAKENQFGPYIQGSVWTGEDAPEMAPSQLSAEAVDSTSIIVNWTEIQANKRNGIIIGYSVKWKEVNFDSEAGNISVPATPLSYTVTGLKIFTYYKVFVAGFTVIGIGPYKETVDVRTGEDIPDASPNITKAYNASSTSLFVMWQAIPEQNRNGILQGYVFEVCKEDGTFEKLFYHNSSSLEARITGLSKYQTYQIKIAGFTSKGRGNFSLPVIATTDEDVPESPPRNISKQKEESNAVTLAWQPPSSKQANGIILGYNITLKDLLRDKISYKRVNTSTHLRIDGLYPYTDYEITIRAFTRKGDGIVSEKIAIKTEPSGKYNSNAQSNPSRKKRAVPSGTMSTQLTGFQPFTQYGIQILAVTNVNGVPSPIYNVTTAEDAPSHPPLNLTAHNTSSTSIKATWNEIPQKHKNGIIIGYKIHYKASHTGNFIKTVINDTERHTELTGLEKYELYSIQILGFTVKGDGNLSEPVIVRTAEDVPDDGPAKVSSVNPTLTTLTIQWETMPVRLENGIIRGYEVVLFEMNGTTKANAVLNEGNNKLSTVISGLDVWTNYTVQVKAFTSVGPGPWSPRVRVTTDEQAPQDTPFNVTAHFLSSTSIRVSWQPIDPRLTKGVARGYRVYYRALDTPFTKQLLNHTVGLTETSADLTNLYKYVEYSIYVVAVTNKDGNASAVVVTRTNEDKPDRPPLTLIYTLPDPTSIWLGWDEVREGYKNGIILGYKMTYRDTTKSDPPTLKSFLPDQFSTTLRDLDSYIHYEITLLAFTIKGDGPPFTRVIRTDQNTPYMSPGNFTAENYTTTSSLPVLWQPIPPHGLPGILLGYRLYYTPVSTGEYDIEEGETKEIRIPADKTQFVLSGLDIYTKYRVEISGFTVKGDGPLSITFGDTCRCQKRLSSSWLHFPPYVIASDNDSVPAGIIPSIAQEMVLHCCHHCKEYGKSYLDMKLNGYNMPAQEKHLEALKIHIDGMTDIIFPVAGYRTQEVYKVPYGFIGLVGTPGVAFVLSTTSTDGLMVGEIAASIWKNWTLVLLSLLFAFITGCLIWFLENRKNEEHFPKPFSKGSMEGFWFTFISMTTVGYGDRCPLSVAGRIVAITWTLFGVVLISMIVGNIAASLTTVAVNEGGSLYGMKAGALKNSFEYRFGIRRSAKMNKEREYDSYDEIYDDLVNQRIKGALLDSFAVGSRRDLFEKPFIRIKSIYDLNLASGIVTARNSTKLNRCLRRFTRSNAKEISDTIKDNARAVE